MADPAAASTTMPADNPIDEALTAGPVVPTEATPLAIQVEGLKKAFRIPTHRIDSFKERALRMFSSGDYRELRALDGVSFEVRQGEFFGIVGRNGSGKSTLLKLLASIYRADEGKIRMAGRLAPFIELGVGFNVELTARENVVLNGVMMGLTPAEASSRLEAVLEFAELEEFVDLKLKNYSSGMLVRLAFATMLQADADVLLIDEVLAVGDASFQQKCADAFRRMKNEGKTIVLVTHEMATVEAYCHRAMLIADGKIQLLGAPNEIAAEYLRLNFQKDAGSGIAVGTDGDGVRLLDAWVADAAGERATSVEHGTPIRFHVEIELERDVSDIGVGFVLANADGLGMFQFGLPIENPDGGTKLTKGQRVRIDSEMENSLAPGRYYVHCGVQRHQAGGEDVSLYAHNAFDFLVFGGPPTKGLISPAHELKAVIDPEPGA